jgi:hypothetical protein
MIKLLLVPVALFAFVGTSLGQGTTPAPAKPAAPAKATEKKEVVKVLRGRGEVAVADTKAGTLKVKVKDKELSFNAESKESKEGLAKVKMGDNVRVTYTEKEGKLTLRSVGKVRTRTDAKSSQQKTEKPETTKPAK